MAKRVNKTLVGFLAAAGFVVMTFAGLAMIYQLRQIDPAHYEKLAQDRVQEGDFEQAKTYYWRAFDVSNDAHYLVEVGNMFYKQGDGFNAGGCWEQAITINPELVDAHEKRLDLFVVRAQMSYDRVDRWVRVKEAAEELIKVDDQNAKALFSMGLALAKLPPREGGDPDAAIEYVHKAVRLAPTVVEYSLRLAGYSMEQATSALARARKVDAKREFDQAENILKQLLATNQTPGADASRVRYAYGSLLATRQRLDEARKLYEAAEEFAGEGNDDEARETRATAKAQHAQYWINRGARATNDSDLGEDPDPFFDKAQNLLEKSIEIYPTGFDHYMMLGKLLAYRDRRVEAIDVYQRRADEDVIREGLKASRSKYLIYTLLLQAADECLAHAASLDRSEAEYDEFVEKAEQFANDAGAEIPDAYPGLHTLAKVRFTQGRDDEAISLLERAERATLKPDWKISTLLAQLLARAGQPGAAKEAIDRAMQDPEAGLSCGVTLAEILLQTDETEDARTAIDKVLRQAPDFKGALQTKMRILQRQGGQQPLVERIKKQLNLDTPETALVEADAIRKTQPDKALEILDRTLAKQPGHARVLAMAVQILTDQDRYDEAQQRLKRAKEAAPDDADIPWIEITANPNLSQEERDRAYEEFLKKTEDPFKRAYKLARWYQRQDQTDNYRTLLNEAAELVSAPETMLDSVSRRHYLKDIIERIFVLAARDEDPEGIERAVQWAIKENIDGADGLTYRGQAHMLAEQPDLALTAFNLALSKRPNDSDTLANAAQCYMAMDPPQPFEAKVFFARAVAVNPNQGRAHRGLAILARMENDRPLFLQELQRCAKLIPDDPWVQAQLLDQQERSNPRVGIERRLKIRQREPDNEDNLIQLALLYADRRVREPENAEECYDAVLALDDVTKASVVTAATFFRNTKKPDRALQILEDLAERTEGTDERAGAVLLIAEHWLRMDNLQEVETALRRAAEISESIGVCNAFAKLKTKIGDFPAAIEWYDRAIQLADESSPNMVAGLRREKIDVHFRAGDAESAKRDIEDYREDYPEDPTGSAMRSVVQSLTGDIEGAITSLSRFLERKPNDLRALLRRARLYGGQGRWALGIADLERVRAIEPTFSNFEPRILLADGYSLTQQLPKAFAELETILRNLPETRNVATHLIRLYREHQRFADAIRIATSMVNRFPEEPKWLGYRAETLAKMNDANATFADYHKAAEISNYAASYTAAMLKACVTFEQIDRGLQYYESIPEQHRAPQVVGRYGELLAHHGQVDEAVKQFRIALNAAGLADIRFMRELISAIQSALQGRDLIDLFRKAPDDPNLKRANNHILGVLLIQGRQFSEALATFETLVETTDNPAEKIALLGSIGNVYEAQSDWENASKAYEQLLEINGRSILGLNNLAYLLSDKLSRPRDALPYAKRAVDVLPIPTILDTLGRTHVQVLEYREAISVLTQAVQKDPRFVPALYHL
ncbi:MAG: tetratricopeptide repeat protein, partial [Planctomycetes bacterium]|nr:tetratricopeptide repeat protein [Planctomycetota bacterium]